MQMIGMFVNVSCVAIGGLLGAFLSNRMSDDMKDKLNMILGLAAMSMGMNSVVQMQNLPAVVFCTIVGTYLGMVMGFTKLVNKGGMALQKGMSKIMHLNAGMTKEQESVMITAVVLFCASGTGIYGTLVAGMLGEQNILLSKAILDLPTALIFACTVGVSTAAIALPQLCIYLVLFALAKVIYPLCTPAMIGDLKAIGGILMLAAGFRMLKLKDFPVADMVIGIIMVLPVSYLWAAYVVPFLA